MECVDLLPTYARLKLVVESSCCCSVRFHPSTSGILIRSGRDVGEIPGGSGSCPLAGITYALLGADAPVGLLKCLPSRFRATSYISPSSWLNCWFCRTGMVCVTN